MESPSFSRMSPMRGIGYASFVEVAKTATVSYLSSFLLGNFEGFIMSYSSSISICARHALTCAASCVSLHLCEEQQLLPVLSCTGPGHNSPCPLYNLEKTSAFRFKTPLSISNAIFPIFSLKCSVSGKNRLIMIQFSYKFVTSVVFRSFFMHCKSKTV